jgi:hypothetical protein
MAKTKLTRAKAKDYRYERTDKRELKFEQGAYGERFRSGVSNQQSANVSLGNEQMCRPVVMIEVIWFSKIHLVLPDEFVAKAKDYHRILRNEALILYGDLKDNKKIYQEWANPSGFIDSAVAHAVSGTSAIVGWFKEVKRAPKPDLKEFNILILRVEAVSSKIERAASTLLYADIHDIGVELALIREDSRRLYRQIEKFRNLAIDTAEDMTHGLETVESASFQVLTIVPTITMMDPLREAAYRISLVILRAGARSAGAALADTSIVQELCGVLKADVPPLIVDVATSGLNKYLKGIKVPVLERDFCIFIVKQQIEFICDLVLMVNAKGSSMNEEDLKQLGMNRLTSVIAELLSKVLGGNPTDAGIKKLAKSLAESTLNTVFRDAMTAKETAKNTNRTFWEVFLSELPWTIVKIIQGTFVGVMHRNAAALAHEVNYQGVTDPNQGAGILKSQKASSIFNGKLVMPEGALVKNKTPLPPMRPDEYRQWAKDLQDGGANLHPDLAGPLRRYAHDADQYVAFRIPGPAMKEYLSEFSMWPKPEWIKAKTAKLTDQEGKVVKPSIQTHGDNFEEANKLWEDSIGGIRNNGAMVNEDGVVFHPNMLKDWARSHPEDREAAETAHAYLTGIQSGTWDLTTESGQRALAAAPNTRALLQRVRVGFYSDLDLAEVIDASSGSRIAMGAGNEDDSDELAYLHRNRNNLDKEINVNDDLKNIPQEFGDPDGRPRVSADRKTPHHVSLIQHGSNEEYYKGPLDGPLAVVGPNGTFRTFRNRAEFEEGMKRILGDKYQATSIRGQQLVKNSWDDPTHWAEANGNGERVRTDKLARMQWYYQRAKRDIDGRGHAVSLNDVAASLFHRGLSMELPAYARIRERDLRKIQQVQSAYQTLIAGDLDGENLVLATQANGMIADALARLARAAKDLSLGEANGVKVWFEIYSAFKPVTSDYILNRIGGQDPGIGPDFLDVQEMVSSFVEQKGKKLFAFCLDGFVETYSPLLKYVGARGRSSLDQRDDGQRDKEIRDTVVASLGSKTGDYGKMRGQKLTDVWETTRSRRLSKTGTEISCQQVVVFTAGMAACPETVIPRELTDLTPLRKPIAVG